MFSKQVTEERKSAEKTSNLPGGCFPKPGSLELAVRPQAAQLPGEMAGRVIKYCNLTGEKIVIILKIIVPLVT